MDDKAEPIERANRDIRNRAKQGISPLIAAVILVSIAIILAVSLSGFASSMLGTYSNSPQVTIRGMHVHEAGTGKILFYNAGGETDSVTSVQVSPNPPIDLRLDSSSTSSGDYVTDGGGNTNDHPLPSCTDHSDDGNCMHDQDAGQSGSSQAPQNGQNGVSNNNTGNIGTSQNGPGPGNNEYSYARVLLRPNSQTEISWADLSLGDFVPGQMITVEIHLGSGNTLTYSTLISTENE